MTLWIIFGEIHIFHYRSLVWFFSWTLRCILLLYLFWLMTKFLYKLWLHSFPVLKIMCYIFNIFNLFHILICLYSYQYQKLGEHFPYLLIWDLIIPLWNFFFFIKIGLGLSYFISIFLFISFTISIWNLIHIFYIILFFDRLFIFINQVDLFIIVFQFTILKSVVTIHNYLIFVTNFILST